MSRNNKNTPAVESAAGLVEANEAIADKELADKALADKAIADKELADKALADKEIADKVHEAIIIPSGKFIAENGDEYEFNVNSFSYQGITYTKEEALTDHNDVLEHLASINSFILKKV